MATATKNAPTSTPAEKTSLECLQQALDDLDSARLKAQQDVRSTIDSAVERIREARKELTTRSRARPGTSASSSRRHKPLAASRTTSRT